MIGGGDTGTDCVGTSVRHGCSGIVQFEIMDRPPNARPPDNPWPEWPSTFRTDYGQEEAIDTFGKDPREYAITTKRFVGDANGHVREVHTVRVAWEQVDGRHDSRRDTRARKNDGRHNWCCWRWASSGPERTLIEQLGLEQDARSNVRAEYGKFETSVPGVFAAGDMRRGQSLVVWAINEGRGAARECDRYLMGSTQLP